VVVVQSVQEGRERFSSEFLRDSPNLLPKVPTTVGTLTKISINGNREYLDILGMPYIC